MVWIAWLPAGRIEMTTIWMQDRRDREPGSAQRQIGEA